MNRNSFFKRGSGVFTCIACGRKTRDTGVQSLGSECCPDCFEIAGIYNTLQDGGDVSRYAAEIRELCKNITDKGGKLDSDALELLDAIKEVAS